jgi:integrase
VKTYVAMYRVAGQLRRSTIGHHPGMSLRDAREKAGKLFEAVEDGGDPRVEKADRKAEQARANGDLYISAVDDFIAKHAVAKKQNRQHGEQRRLLLRANPAWHSRPVSSITVREVHDALDRLMEEGKGYSANRVYEALKTFWRWLYQRDRVKANIMEKVDKPFDGEAARTRVWTDEEIKAIWKAADQLGAHERVYLKLLLLLGQRRGEIAGMQWTEIDLDGKTWKLPADRAKNKHDHTFPLTDAAVELLKSLPRCAGNPFVFPGRGGRDGAPCPITIGTKVQNRIQAASGVADFTFHDARRVFRTGLDRLHILPHIKDECLNHTRRGVGDIHYSKYDYLPEQRSAFDAWAAFIGELVGAKASNVRQFRRKRRAA